MKKGLVGKILEILLEGAATSVDIISAILESGYGAPYSKMDRNYRKREGARLAKQLEYKERQRFFNLISKLKREGFIERKERSWQITHLGKDKFKKISNDSKRFIDRPKYERVADKVMRLIIFDIPESEKMKRNWLRDVLTNLGFRMLQKSVWLGEVKIPEDFLEDLRRLRIFQFIHIFAVYKSGTIKEE